MTSTGDGDDFLLDSFPDGFQWGTATSSYQIEGAWNADGKGESIWDRFCHVGGKVRNGDTGDVACDSYHRYREDIAMLKNLGVHFYRFSLSWPRILPQGTVAVVNDAGVDYYNRLIDGLLAEGIQPMVTIFHWDLPQALEDIGGWLNPSIVKYFDDYARFCFQRFGDRVKLWLTINEPYIFSLSGYENGSMAPGLHKPDVGAYQAGHNLIKAHAEAWHTYDKEFRQSQKGRITLVLVGHWFEPQTNKREDVEAADRAMEFMLGWFANPVFVNGDYPEVMKESVKRKSKMEGRKTSRLPEFTEAEKKRIKGTHDFFALNHYTARLTEALDAGSGNQRMASDGNFKVHIDPSWPRSGLSWLFEYPSGMRKTLNWIKEHYNNPEVMITESGVADDQEHRGSLNDSQRIRFYKGYINSMLKAIKLDGCNVSAYTAWSLMDNFEWIFGYEATFGLYRVDFSDPMLPRVPKASSDFYKQLIRNNGWPPQANL